MGLEIAIAAVTVAAAIIAWKQLLGDVNVAKTAAAYDKAPWERVKGDQRIAFPLIQNETKVFGATIITSEGVERRVDLLANEVAGLND